MQGVAINSEISQIARIKLLKSFNYTYTQPSGGLREYVYTLFQRTV